MLDIKFVRENPDIVKENIKKKFQDSKLPLVDEVIALEPLLLKGAPLKIVVRQERLTCDSDTVRRLAGKVALRNGIQCGISGWELENELLLRGIPGKFSILLDRFGNFMPKSFKLASPPSNGKDLKLKESLEELEQQSQEEPDL